MCNYEAICLKEFENIIKYDGKNSEKMKKSLFNVIDLMEKTLNIFIAELKIAEDSGYL